ncbi:hypothetical protein PBAC_05260 [Pedobacter glucosidilyticus]|nr:BatA domain-containing protein [Pedobacter glucosidilyticus]KHJ39213.1 hypothetical protein PBAC_05260 [Pedobacter glucosidilyticus]
MKFYYPEFLFGLLLIAIPVIIHLFNFRKFKKVYFSNTSFLKDIQQQTSSRRNIKERLILLSRILAITFLVLAFAKPYVPEENTFSASQNHLLSIYIDNSYSMEAVNQDGRLLDEAKRKAKEIVATYGLTDKFQLLSNDFNGSQNRLLDKEAFLEALDAIEISARTYDYQQVLNQQERFFNTNNGYQKHAYLVSDFQQQGNLQLQKDSTAKYHLIKLKANSLPNVAVDSVWFISPLHRPQSKEQLVVRVKNYSDKSLADVSLTLKINNQIKAIGKVAIAPLESSLDTLTFSGLNNGWQKGELRVKDYPMVFDDALFFAFQVKKELPITIINQTIEANAIASAFETDSFFKVQSIGESQINYSDLKQQHLIVLHNLKRVSDGLSQQMITYLKNGGNLSVFLPLEADLTSYTHFLKAAGANYPVRYQKDSVMAASLNLKHPVFENVFENIPQQIDLPKTSGYYQLSNVTKTNKQNLMEVDAGLPLLQAYQLGKGNLYLSAITLDPKVSNFTNHGLFLPLLFKMALLKRQEQTLFYILGMQETALIDNVDLAASEVLTLKSAQQEIIPELRNTSLGTVIFFADQVKAQGFYDLYKKDKLLAVLAFNQSRKESDLSYASDADLNNSFGKNTEIIEAGTSSIANQIKEVKLGASLWKLCIILVLIFLALEMLLIKYFKIQANKTAIN